MTEREPRDLQLASDELIERTRRALSPRDADQARVLEALSERLFGAQAEPAADVPMPLPAAPPLRAAVKKLWLAMVSAALLGALAVAIGMHKPAPVVPSVPRVPPTQVEATVAPEPVVNNVLPPQPAPEPPAAPKEKKKARKRCFAANGGERPCPSAPAPTALATNSAPADSSLREELDALRKAERALREREPARALEVLDAFERAAAGRGVMQEERNAAATAARCALATGGGKELYESFVHRYPSSAYATRLRQSCLMGKP